MNFKKWALVSLMLTIGSAASATTLSMTGIGIDGQACSVTIVKDGETLRDIILNGAAKVYEVIAEKGDSYGPDTRIEGSADDIFGPIKENKALDKMKYSNAWFSDNETYSFNTADYPELNQELKAINMKMELKLTYKLGSLVKVEAVNQAKALKLLTLASKKFVCEVK